MFDTINTRFWTLPLWGSFAVVVTALLALQAVFMAWGSRHFVTAWLQSFVAVSLYWFSILGSIALAYLAGWKTSQTSGHTWLGWAVGITVFVACTYVSTLFEDIPGIGWRIELIREYSGTSEYY